MFLNFRTICPNLANYVKKLPGRYKQSSTTKDKGYTPLISNQDPDPFLVEAYRTLLTNIQFCQPTKPLKTLLITSTGPQEGKSSVVANLGILMAQGGSKVLLVDADMRSPTLSKIFKVPNSSGLTDLLLQISSLQLIRGNLEKFSVGDTFQLLKIQKKTGILTVEKKEKTVSFFFKDGEVIEANSENTLSTQGLGEIFRIKNGTFHFQETVSLNDHIDLPDNPGTEVALQKNIPQLYRQPFIESRLTSFLKPTYIENLMLLTGGSLPPNPPQLLSSESMKTVLNMSRNMFDAVIFDSPPIGLVTDSSVLASITDGIILVIKQGSYDKKLVQRAKERIEKANSNICGVVLSQVDLKGDAYSYYGGYGYGYMK